MQTLKISLTLLFALGFNFLFAQDATTPLSKSDLEGQWEIDLRPTPDADPYFKNFTLQFFDDRHFAGAFYDTPFDNGVINSAWDGIYFAFSTKDRKSIYVTTGHFDGEKLTGMTYCEERDFVMPWTGKRKKSSSKAISE